METTFGWNRSISPFVLVGVPVVALFLKRVAFAHSSRLENPLLVKFHSSATGSITMFHEAAAQLIRLMGASGRIPSALSAEEVPGALTKLRAGLAHTAPSQPSPSKDAREEKEAPIGLATRAQPLIELLERAAAADAEVMWEKQ
jgi:hypothetical protein